MKSANVKTVTRARDVIEYTYVVANTGNVTLGGVAVTDDRILAPTAVRCPEARLTPGATTICGATYTVTQADVDAGRITNTAVARATPPTGPAVASAPGSVTVTATQSRRIEVGKASTATTVTAGQSLDFTITLANTGKRHAVDRHRDRSTTGCSRVGLADRRRNGRNAVCHHRR
jgi:hypothetical protein